VPASASRPVYITNWISMKSILCLRNVTWTHCCCACVFSGRMCVRRVASSSVLAAVAPAEATRTKARVVRWISSTASSCLTWTNCDCCDSNLPTLQVDTCSLSDGNNNANVIALPSFCYHRYFLSRSVARSKYVGWTDMASASL